VYRGNSAGVKGVRCGGAAERGACCRTAGGDAGDACGVSILLE
jgi:hypothetical protein